MRIAPLGIFAASLALSAGPSLAQPVQVVSRADPGMISATGGGSVQAHVSSVSADGRYVAFSSLAPNLAPGQLDGNESADVFLRDRVAGTTTLVSHAVGLPTTAASGASYYQAISADGAYVAFASTATNLVAGTDSNAALDVFLFERATGLVSLVSHVPGSPLAAANALSISPVLSGGGGQVAFMSRATDLVPGTDTNGEHDVFLYERSTGAVTLVSHALGAPSTASEGLDPVVSRDGAYVGFLSPGTDLVAGSDTNGDYDVFLFERGTGLVRLASHSVTGPGAAGNYYSTGPVVLSQDAGLVGFVSLATDLVAGSDTNGDYDVFLFERASGTVSLVSHALAMPSTAGNGRSAYPSLDGAGDLVAFESTATDLVAGTDTNGANDVFLFERATGNVGLVSHAASSPTQAGNAFSQYPLLSASGQGLSFASWATDLVAGADGNSRSDVFLHDRASGANVLASHALGSTTTAGAGESYDGSLSDDGSSLVLYGTAYDLVPGDLNGPDGWDVFAFESTTGLNDLVSAREASMPGLTGSHTSTVSGSLSAVRRGSRVSGDGRYVAFQSYAVNLVPGQVVSGLPYLRSQVFLFDQQSGAMTLVSHAPGQPSTTCDGVAQDPVISRDGRYVAFESDADLLGSGPTPGVLQVFLYDRVTGVTRLASHALGAPNAGGNGESTLSSISADGSRVGFASLGTDFVTGADNNGLADAFVFETVTGAVSLVSHVLGSPHDAGNGLSFAPVLSADGRFAAFNSYATNLVSGTDPYGLDDVFLFDCQTGAVTLVSHVAGNPGMAANGASADPTLSDDGAYVAFQSFASDLMPGVGPGNVFVFERAGGGLTLCSHAAGLPTTGGNSGSWLASIAGSGTAVLFVSRATDLVPGSDLPNTDDMFVWDRLTGDVAMASHVQGDPAAAGNGASVPGTISGDGNVVAFSSRATNLVGGLDSNGDSDAFLYDRRTGTVRLVSHRPGLPTAAGNFGSFDGNGPMVSDGGAHVAFTSRATDLVPGDYNGENDVFLLGPTGPTTADLALTVSDGQTTAVPGTPVTYTVAVTNPGPGSAYAALLTDSLPSALTGATWSCSGSGGALCYSPGGSGNVSVLADAPVGSTLTVLLAATIDPAATGALTNTASVTLPSGFTDPNPADNTASDTDTLTPEADLAVGQSDAPDPVPAGQALSYTVTTRNQGPSQAAGGSLTDTLPSGTTLVSTVPGPPTCNAAAGSVTCSVPPLAPSAASVVQVTVQTAVAGGITNTAAVTGTTSDPFGGNDTASEGSLVVNRPPAELAHGAVAVRDLSAATSPTDGPDFYRMRQEPGSSYQVVVDAATGDIGSGAGPLVDRVGDDGASVIQSSVPAGAGGSRSLAWQNGRTVAVDEEYVRVQSAGCAPCGPEDSYRIRAFETTLNGPRFNNTGSQVTVLALENITGGAVVAILWFRGGAGALLASQAFVLAPRGTLVVNTSSIVPGLAGSVAVSHDGPYGGLTGKLVSLEPATGFSFDTPLRSRPR